MIVDMHCHILTEEMIRLMQGVSKTYAPFLTTTDTPYPSGLTTSSQGYTLTFPSRNSTTTWPEGGHNVELRLSDMARTGVDCQAISPFVGSFLYEIPTEVNVEFCKLYNEEFHLLASTGIKSIADLSGLKFRTYNAATSRLAQLIKAVPTQIEVPDIPTAFSTGRVESMFTSPSTGVDSKAWDFLTHYHNL